MITLPWPPTNNTYYRNVNGKMLLSQKARKYRKTIGQECLVQRVPKFGKARVKVEIMAYPPDRFRRDLDNLLKALLDSLQHAGVYDNDSQIDDLRIKRGLPIKGGRVDVEVEEL